MDIRFLKIDLFPRSKMEKSRSIFFSRSISRSKSAIQQLINKIDINEENI
jgi:hypothetical protein